MEPSGDQPTGSFIAAAEGKWDATTRRGNCELSDRMMGEVWLVAMS